jgi:Tfp pilus assembly protein PilV
MLDRRRGITLLEVVVSALLTGVMLMVSAQMLGWAVQARRTVDQRAVALQEAASLLDELTSLPWPEVTPERVNASVLSAAAAESLPEAKLEVALHEPDDDATAKRVTVTITWQSLDGLDEAPARLTAWMYRRTKN